MTPRDMPRLAMMNENSPIGARETPPLTAVSISCPERIIPIVANMSFATTAITAIGMIAGTLFNEKAAPGICSIFISLGSFVGGIWYDVDGVGGVMQKISRCTPFYYAVKAVRSAIALDFSRDDFFLPMIVVTGAAVILTVTACFAFRGKMRADLA